MEVPVPSDKVCEEFTRCAETVCTKPSRGELESYLRELASEDRTKSPLVSSTSSLEKVEWKCAVDRLLEERIFEPCIECTLLTGESEPDEVGKRSWSKQYRENRRRTPLPLLYVWVLRCERAMEGRFSKRIAPWERAHPYQNDPKMGYMWRDSYTRALIRELGSGCDIHLLDEIAPRVYSAYVAAYGSKG